MERRLSRVLSSGGTVVPDEVLKLVMEYMEDPHDRAAISQVCKQWKHIDSVTRKHVTIAMCYSATPASLRRRFPYLESLKLKGKPRAAMYNLLPEDWGAYVEPWANEIATAFHCMKSIHFRRMIVSDTDLEVLAQSRGSNLLTLKLDRCSGFSTDGLRSVASSCRHLRTLVLDESFIVEKDGDWLHELAIKNRALEILNFYMAELQFVSVEDLETITRNCRSLVSLKISECDILDLLHVLQSSSSLQEFFGGSFSNSIEYANKYVNIRFPPRLQRLGLIYMGKNHMPAIFSCASSLTKLDLQYTFLDTEDHCQLLGRCPNLEVLEARNVIGDRGLEVVSCSCKKLRRLRVEHGEDEQGMEDEQGTISHIGLSAVAQGCPELTYMAVYVSDINNAALESVGTHCKNMRDFRLVLLDKEERITELPIDNGVRALLIGCEKLERLAIYLRPGGLSDLGLSYIGIYGNKVRYMLLGCVGQSDLGLLEFSLGCPCLEKLEMRACLFSEGALARAVMRLSALKYLWVQGYKPSVFKNDLLEMVRPYWNIEVIHQKEGIDELGGVEQPAQVLAYYSLAGRRTDCPETVIHVP